MNESLSKVGIELLGQLKSNATFDGWTSSAGPPSPVPPQVVLVSDVGPPRPPPQTTFSRKSFQPTFFREPIDARPRFAIIQVYGCFLSNRSSPMFLKKFFSHLFLLDPVVGNLFNCFFELLFRGNPAKTFLLQENNNRTITGKSTNRIDMFFNINRLG